MTSINHPSNPWNPDPVPLERMQPQRELGVRIEDLADRVAALEHQVNILLKARLDELTQPADRATPES